MPNVPGLWSGCWLAQPLRWQSYPINTTLQSLNGRDGCPDRQLRVPRGCSGGMALMMKSHSQGSLGYDVLRLERATEVAVASDREL